MTLPNIKWGLLYGVILCNARAMGEFGAVSVVSGHIRGLTNTMPLHVEILYNEYNFVAAFAVASLRVTFFASFAAALANTIFGLVVAWVLVRYSFPGKRVVDALVDLPFALPTAVAGIVLATLYAPNGWLGQHFAVHDIKVAYTPLGIVVALTFIGLPFVVRSAHPAGRPSGA